MKTDVEKQQAQRKAVRKYQQTHKVEYAECQRKYRQTIIGHLRCCFSRIKQRCNNPKNPYYKNYGKRGIKCLFENADGFVEYVINVLRIDPRSLDIDRIDNNGHYEKGNIRFVTHKENCNNGRVWKRE